MAAWKLLDAAVSAGSARVSFSQEGEDRILERLTEGSTSRLYVDVGAHHPVRFSNTFAFYLRGWRGINIDPLPGAMERFEAYRPRDVNVPYGIALERETKLYHMFNEPAVNTFDSSLAELRRTQGFSPTGTISIPLVPLAEVLNDRLDDTESIAFMTVDAEGLDLDILRSNDWDRHRPSVLCVEDLPAGISEQGDSPMQSYLKGLGYRAVAHTKNSVMYVDRSSATP